MRDILRAKRYAYRTEVSYVNWMPGYILLHNNCYPQDIAESEVEAILTHLAAQDNVADNCLRGKTIIKTL